MINKTTNLYKLQSVMAAAIMRPLPRKNKNNEGQNIRDLEEHAVAFIKDDVKSSSYARLEIYNKQYWYRLLESLQDDFPGLNAVLGHKCFEKLAKEYLYENPSLSYSMNRLGLKMAEFIEKRPDLVEPLFDLAHDMARFECAELRTICSPTEHILNAQALASVDPNTIRLKVQPHLNILTVNYVVDDFILSLGKEHEQNKTSNACINRTIRFNNALSVKKRRIFVAIHRFNNIVYYKRLYKDEYTLLNSLIENKTIGEACSTLIASKEKNIKKDALAAQIKKYFSNWMELGWFCKAYS